LPADISEPIATFGTLIGCCVVKKKAEIRQNRPEVLMHTTGAQQTQDILF